MHIQDLRLNGILVLIFFGLFLPVAAVAQENLFEPIGVPNSVALPEHAVAAQSVRVNRRALKQASMRIDLFGSEVIAVRERVERHKAGQFVWIGHLNGNPGDTVIVTVRGNEFSGFIQRGAEFYRISIGPARQSRLLRLDMKKLPMDDASDLPEGGAIPTASDVTPVDGNTVQDLLVVYTQAACTAAGGCSQLEADIVTAVADINTAYSGSGINITMNLVGTTLTEYVESDASQALSDLRGASDGEMDEIHLLRDQLGADIVSLVYDGEGCGIGYLGSSASTSFNVTDEPCLVGNRTMAHEIGHNQGAHHDRTTVGGGSSGVYNYGYRRCNDGSGDDLGSPYYRTVLSYSCLGAPRVGRISNPNVNYLGVPQGVDPDLNPAKGAFNARVLNESASYIAGFRTLSSQTPPTAPSLLGVVATGADMIDLSWTDNSGNESSFILQSSLDGVNWSDIASLSANTTSFTHNGLLPETAYFYQVRAENSAGGSWYSNVASSTTEALPQTIEDIADGDVFIKGTVTGTFATTHVAGGSFQTITEEHSGGPKHRRKQSYKHAWIFDVFGGAGGVIASIDAWISGNEGAQFYYSLDGGTTRYLMFTVDNVAQGPAKTFAFPAGVSGPIRIEVEDSSQSNGESVDSVYVDHIVLTSYTEPGSPPLAPSSMTVASTTSGAVTIEFVDNANDELGFGIWRASSNPANDCNAGTVVDIIGTSSGTEGLVEYVDTTVVSNSTYWYWAKAFNGAGENGECSNVASGTTPAAPAISVSIVRTFKVKGVKQVELSWTGAGTVMVDIVRDAEVVATVDNNNVYIDNLAAKGGGSHDYKICEQGSTSACSPIGTAVF
ncbi:MAG: hypothetical protein COB27_011980 [Moritella sp.]|nr:hypothetical protein [Moritella sp.]